MRHPCHITHGKKGVSGKGRQGRNSRPHRAVMEVPCCAALPVIVKKGLKLAGATIPMEEVVISVRGKILERRQVQAA